ncbi:MAG: tRNA (adenosine(37)-N6)-threonylcarbamoyltransferase complex dimerization subunit type 1 TsaB [Thermoleophilia bacterium]|nr:tRNA (adenosine(37)-N6)-threonylcarbamoyltransferase complex dimerization subunit type 1 TsaB [Thermoleophilia bacterium]
MPALAIDTATEICGLALGGPGGVIDESALEAGRSHVEMLLPWTLDLLLRNGLDRTDITAVVAGTGPGTFTGLRVGIATARGLAQALEVPLAGFSTLEALALGIASGPVDEPVDPDPSGAMDLLPVIDAKRGQIFAQLFRRREHGVEAVSEILCLNPGDLSKRLAALTGRRAMAAGNGALAHYEQFESDPRVEIINRDDSRHRVRAVHHLRAAGDGVFDPVALTKVLPVYVREPDADKTVLMRKKEPWLK